MQNHQAISWCFIGHFLTFISQFRSNVFEEKVLEFDFTSKQYFMKYLICISFFIIIVCYVAYPEHPLGTISNSESYMIIGSLDELQFQRF